MPPDGKTPLDSSEQFLQALQNEKDGKYILRLYIAGNTPKSNEAITNIREICEKHLKGRYQLDVVDISQQPEMARTDQIIATPTLIKYLPAPLRRIIGDLSGKEKILVGLNILPVTDEKG